MMKVSTDVLVIGSGLAGLSAAYVLSHGNTDITILSDGSGASPWIHAFCVPLNENDSVDTFLNDTLESGGHFNNPVLAKALCEDSLICFDELKKMGVEFDREGDGYRLIRPLSASYPRCVSSTHATGPEIAAKIRSKLSNAHFINKSRALRLCIFEGHVSGVLAFDRLAGQFFIIQAKAVILASGGFCGIYPFSTNKIDSGGDGIAMAFDAGVDLVDMEFVQFEPSAAVWPPAVKGLGMITTMLYEGAVFRNGAGERFLLQYPENTECIGKDIMTIRIAREIESGNGTLHNGVWFDAAGVGKDRLNEVYPAYFRRYANVGIDLSKEMIELAPAPHTSLGGVEIDAWCSTSVPGLFACGEITGGIHGANRIGGNAGLETLVFGRRAGLAVSDYLRKNPCGSKCEEDWSEKVIGKTDGKSSANEIAEMRQYLQKTLEKSLGVLREGSKLLNALDVLDTILEHSEKISTRGNREAFDRLRLYNDALTGKLLCLSALERSESTGCHCRIDSKHGDEKPYNVVISGGKVADLQVEREVIIRKRYIS